MYKVSVCGVFLSSILFIYNIKYLRGWHERLTVISYQKSISRGSIWAVVVEEVVWRCVLQRDEK